MPVENWFATPVYYNDKIDNFEAVQEELLNLYEKTKMNRIKSWDTQSALISNGSFFVNLLVKNECPLIIKEIGKNLYTYMDELGYNPVTKTNYIDELKHHTIVITSSWFAELNKNQHHHIHAHGASAISGAYYIKCNGNEPLYFHNPNKLMATTPVLTFMQQVIPYPTCVGKMILFPSWLEHNVMSNQSDNARLVLSFNLNLYVNDR